MDYTVIVPHFRNGKITAVCLSHLLRNSDKRLAEILVVDNASTDGSAAYLKPFADQITLINYPGDRVQSHGNAFSFALPLVKTEHIITVESDSYPVVPQWLDYYDRLAASADLAGSVLRLSGGTYLHPAGALYRTALWKEAEAYCRSSLYALMPNAAKRDGFHYHLMVHKRALAAFQADPAAFGVQLSAPVALQPKEFCALHTMIGSNDESVTAYGQRDCVSEPARVLCDDKLDVIHRVGFEPGQFLCYWALRCGYRMVQVPTEVMWLPGRVNQQQDYTLTEGGFKHLWGMTAYYLCPIPELADITQAKAAQLDALYAALPAEHRTE